MQLLVLYGLYKQATVGDVNTEQPWKVQVEARAKWDAWNANKGRHRTFHHSPFTVHPSSASHFPQSPHISPLISSFVSRFFLLIIFSSFSAWKKCIYLCVRMCVLCCVVLLSLRQEAGGGEG